MGEESARLVPRLEQSVSFGRFEHDDSLCWEKWSAFQSSNKYLEEVEKCSPPGSVAKKKAYFEAHYRKIAAQKAELVDQEKEGELEMSVNSEDHNHVLMNSVCNSDSVHGTELENEVADIVDEGNGEPNLSEGDVIIDEEEKEVVTFTSEVTEHVGESDDCVDIVEENKEESPACGDVLEDLCRGKESSEPAKLEEPVLVKGEDTVVSENKEELPQDKVEKRKIVKKASEDVKSKNLKKTQKVTPVKKTTSTKNAIKKPEARMSKNSAVPMPKSPILSTPKSSKPALSKFTMSATRPLVKKENSFTSLTTKMASRPEIKRVLPTSLHMSLSLGATNSDRAALTTTRKPLIMERMGDKDNVKRAFKSFQTTSQRSPSHSLKAPATTQFAIRKTEQKASPTGTLPKKNEGMPRAAKPSNPRTSQQATRKTSTSPGLQRTSGVDQRNRTSLLASLSSRSQDQGNKQKEVTKNMEQKSKTKQASKTEIQVNEKVERAASIRSKPSQSKLSLSHSQGHGFSKRLH